MDYQERLQILTARREQHAQAANKAQEQVQQNVNAVQQLDGAISILNELIGEQQAATKALMEVAGKPGEVIPMERDRIMDRVERAERAEIEKAIAIRNGKNAGKTE